MRRYHKDLDPGIRLGLAAIGMLWGVTQSSGALAAAADHTPQAGLVLGVFPHVAAAQIENLYAPMVADLGLSLGRPIQLKTKTSFEGFVSELEGEAYDVAFVQPFDYVRAHEKYGYEPLVRRGEPLTGVLVVKEGSELRTLRDVAGKRIGLPPESAAVSHLTKMELIRQKISVGNDVAFHYFKSHDACLHQLMVANIDVCGTAAYPVRYFEAQWKVKFKVLGETQAIPNSLFIAHPRVSKQVRDRIKKIMLAWSDTDAGRKLLEHAQLKPFAAATDAEYDVVRMYLKKK